MPKTDITKETYELLWGRSRKKAMPERWHFDFMQEAIVEPIVRGSLGLEVGCGCGYDTYRMAKSNPSARLVSTDMSNGVFEMSRLVSSLGNVAGVKCSALAAPFKDSSFDFVYSYGVLHHTTDPKAGLREICRVLKDGSPAYLYLYEDHSEDPVKHAALKAVSLARTITTRLPRKILFAISTVLSPVIFALFTVPARILARYERTRGMAGRMPFNFAKGPFALSEDLYDRFGAPIEYRFGRKELNGILEQCGFGGVNIKRLKGISGWVAWGYKR